MIVWAVETIVASTLLMLVVLAIRTPVRRAFGPAVAYALWALPALRMILPPLPASWRGEALPVLPAPEDITVYLGQPVLTLPVEPASGLGWTVIALIAWGVGAAGFIAWHVVAHRRFCARVRRQARETLVVARGKVSVIETDAATGPLAFGVFRKYVAFPRDFAERYDPLERDLALAHELGHHARGDLIANWIALVVLALHWFSPVAWLAFRAFRADQEMACDALVLAGRAPALRHAYGRAIVKSAHGGAVSAACHLHTVNEIKGRLRMLGKHERTSRPRLFGGSATVAVLAAIGLGLTASGTQAAEHVRTTVEDATGVDLANIELPALPDVPASPQATEARSDRKTRVHVVRTDGGKVSATTHEAISGADGKPRTIVIRTRKDKVADGMSFGPPMPPMPPMPAMPPMPPEALVALKAMPTVISGECGKGDGSSTQNVVHRRDGGKRVMIICTNRIEAMASQVAARAMTAESQARWVEKYANASALGGLRRARATIEANASMSADQRAAALAGIDQAVREVESERGE